MKKIVGLSAIIVILDQVVKWIVISTMNIGESIKIIGDFFYLTYVKNTGAAFSILEGRQPLFIIMSFIIMGIVYCFFIYKKKLNKLEIISYGLILGGIVGNLIDRIRYNAVIDYLDFIIFKYDFPIFNIADIGVVLGAFLLIYLIIRGEKNE